MQILLRIALAIFTPTSDADAEALQRFAPSYVTIDTAREHVWSARVAAAAYGVDADMTIAIAYHESRFTHNVVSKEADEEVHVQAPTRAVPRRRTALGDRLAARRRRAKRSRGALGVRGRLPNDPPLPPGSRAPAQDERRRSVPDARRIRADQVPDRQRAPAPSPQHLGPATPSGLVSDDSRDRAVDIELLAPEIEALRETALRYTRAVNEDRGAAGAGLDLETAAIHYVRKLDDELRKAKEVDYVAIVEKEERDQESSDN